MSNGHRCTCYVLPHEQDCGALIGITKSGAAIFQEQSAPDLIFESPPCEPFAAQRWFPPAPIDSVQRRLEAWAEACRGGAMNLLNVDGVLWSWSTAPRMQKNGAAIGRVYRQDRGEPMRDIGSYKIGADGTVLALPEPLRAMLPGAAGAQASGPEEEGP